MSTPQAPLDAATTRIAAAFALWEERYRADPSQFLTHAEFVQMSVATLSEQRAIYLNALLREVDAEQAGAA